MAGQTLPSVTSGGLQAELRCLFAPKRPSQKFCNLHEMFGSASAAAGLLALADFLSAWPWALLPFFAAHCYERSACPSAPQF
ncbi:MAG: hypothetical protein BJ554DRAFT_7312 [Olpidium bornovanus]|uniref:Uncharacterized protein n=1 Tax=Olpidium bornovanus TaxID=278681 RepID=A0A8H8DJD0_9FUNG|nr:MAG: hypothetical protein BJ554DRAFT_7312 [Olpidium bornovanus]